MKLCILAAFSYCPSARVSLTNYVDNSLSFFVGLELVGIAGMAALRVGGCRLLGRADE